jgi:glycosyltransferase involved in cell wall biosynthesis
MNSALRILFTLHGYKPAYRIGGPILSVSALAEALVRKGHSVTVFTTNCNMSEDVDVPVDCPQLVEGVEVWYFRRQELLKKMLPFVPYVSKSMGYLYAPAMANQLNRTVPYMDVVHTHLPFIYPTFAAARAARLHHKPLFYHQRGVFDPARLSFRSLKKRLFLGIVEQPILRSATTLIALTDVEVASYRALCPSIPCRVIPNGIDVESYRIQPDNSTILNLRPETAVILFLGRLHPIKGADKLIEAFLRVCKQFPDVILVMAGPDEFMIENQFRSMVKQSGLQNRIFFPGMVMDEIKRDLLARADLFCLPSDAEGFSMAILEALASETAVMISPGCHFPEVEKAGVGKVLEAEPEAMAKAMIKLLNDRKQLEDMGRKGREFVTRNYSWDTIAGEIIDAYQEGIARHLRTNRS